MRSLTRREFLKIGGIGLASFAIPRWVARAGDIAGAVTPTATPAPARTKSLVLIVLGGGNDGLNMVAPLADPLYKKLRPTLAIPSADLLKLDDAMGLHPSLKKLRELYERGGVAVVQNVGYPNSSRSHFRSMEIWQTGQVADGPIRDGWLGRTGGAISRGGPDSTQGRPRAVALAGETPLALWADDGGTLTLEGPESFDLPSDQRRPKDRAALLRAMREIYAQPREGPAEILRTRGLELFAEAERVKRIAQTKGPTMYPNNGLANGLKFVAGAIEDGFGARFYMIGLGGFDTHGNQRQQHANLLTTLGDSIAAFQADLEARGIADDVVTMTFSEFGRRVQENGSQGTDHGSAAPLFIVGKGVKGGVIGEAPRLDQLDHGDVPWKIDFRQVYATLLDRWVGVPSETVLGGKFEPLGVL